MLKGINLISTVVLCLIGSVAAFSQWSVGPKVSMGTITTGENNISIVSQSYEISPEIKFIGGGNVVSLGVMAFNKIGPGFLQVEVAGTKYDLEFEANANPYSDDSEMLTLTERSYIIEIPVIAGFYHKNFKLGVGPAMELNVDKESELSVLNRYEDTTNKLDGSFQWLLGYNRGAVHIDLRYAYKFTNLVDGFAIGEDRLKLNKSANRLSLNVGVAF